MYLLFILVVILVTASLPFWDRRLLVRLWPARILHLAPAWLPLTAALCFGLAGFLPDIHISRETNTFQEHFVGGGLYCALLFSYFVRRFGLRLSWRKELLLLFAFTCSLGVANELLEFTVTKLGIMRIDISDTSWDLAANNTGALVGYMLLLLADKMRKIF